MDRDGHGLAYPRKVHNLTAVEKPTGGVSGDMVQSERAGAASRDQHGREVSSESEQLSGLTHAAAEHGPAYRVTHDWHVGPPRPTMRVIKSRGPLRGEG